MANALQSYVEKFILNPNSNKNLDEDGQEIESGKIVDKLIGNEAPILTSVSKLRARNSTLLDNPKYGGAKISRKSLEEKSTPDIDPELAKLCMVEASESESENDEPNQHQEDTTNLSNDENEDEMDYSQFAGMDDSEEEDDDDDEEDDSAQDEDIEEDDDVSHEEEGEISHEEGEEMSHDEDLKEDMSDDEETELEPGIKTLVSNDEEEIRIAKSVQSQLGLFDSLFAIRIAMQKLMLQTKQLPQPDVFSQFSLQNDPHYNSNLKKTQKNCKTLMSSLKELQEMVLKSNKETRHIITGKKAKNSLEMDSDEEITSSEDDIEEEEEIQPKKKRKLDSKETEIHLNKTHEGLTPFRDSVYTKWHEKTKLLSTHKSKFEQFEVSAVQQLRNTLSDKTSLIRRTRLVSVTRGNTAKTLGKELNNDIETSEEYDPEIFDDTDFYKRLLEEVVKSKVSSSDDMINVSRKWVEIQNLRKKIKRKNVNTRSSKGRMTRYDIISKLQQFMAPTETLNMDSVAINSLFRSLFGGALQRDL